MNPIHRGKLLGRALVALLLLHLACAAAFAAPQSKRSKPTKPAKPARPTKPTKPARPAGAKSVKSGKSAPIKVKDPYAPPYAAIVIDVNSGRVLHADKAHDPRHPASLTKMMTLYLLFEALEARKIHIDAELLVSPWASVQERTNLNLGPGQTIRVEDAILGLVTHSANDAAVVIAEALAGTEIAFAHQMTLKARALGMNHTLYRNASGLPDILQVTTARDQAVLGWALQHRFPAFYPYFSKQTFFWRGKFLRSHNKLLGRLYGMDGIKTGYIRMSKFNLVASVRRDGRHLVAAVLGGSSARARDDRMQELIEQCIVNAALRPPPGHKP